MTSNGVSSPWRQLARLETMARWYVWSARASSVMYYWETSEANTRESIAEAVAEQGKEDWGFTVRMHREGVLSDDDRAIAQFMSVELSTIIDCLMHTGTEFSDKAHCSSFSQALYEHVTELAVPLMRLLYSPAETWALPEPLSLGAFDDLRSWLVEWDRVAEDLRVRIDSAWHKLTTVFGEAALEGAPDWVEDSLLPWRSRPAKPAAAPGTPGDPAAARKRLQSQVRRALRESGPTSTPPPTDGLAYEHPLEVLRRFEKHLAEFPTEAGSVAWVATYRGMLWSWGEAVNRRPGLREPFVGMAGLHESEEVRELEDQLRELVRTLVRELTPFAEALPEWEFDVRAYLQPAGMLWFPLLSNQGRIALVAVEDVVSERMMDWTDIRTGLDSIRVLAALRGFRQALLPVLNDIVFALRAQWDYHLPEQNKGLDQETFGRIDGLADKAMQVVGKLEGRLQEGPKARLWQATNRLYWYYHFLSPDPDASFAYVCHSKEGRPLRINYALLRRERQWGDPRGYDWCLQEAEGALRAMRVATEWLCRLQRGGGTEHGAERRQQEGTGEEAAVKEQGSSGSQTNGAPGQPRKPIDVTASYNCRTHVLAIGDERHDLGNTSEGALMHELACNHWQDPTRLLPSTSGRRVWKPALDKLRARIGLERLKAIICIQRLPEDRRKTGYRLNPEVKLPEPPAAFRRSE